MRSSYMVIRRTVLMLCVFAVGICAGASFMAFLSWRANRVYLQMVRMSFDAEEESELAATWRKGSLSDALAHAACGVVVARGPRAFDPARSLWDLDFPIMGVFATERMRYTGLEGNSRWEALAHAKLALVWERIGQSEAARREFKEAARLDGKAGASECCKETALHLLEQAPLIERR
jgi:hypothetical protein